MRLSHFFSVVFFFFNGLDLKVFPLREGIHSVSQETIPGSVAGVIPAKNKVLCKFWGVVLSQKGKRLFKGTAKHIAGKVGWNGVLYLNDSHSRGIGLLGVFFHVLRTTDNWLRLRANCFYFQVLLGVLFVFLVNLYCLIQS